MKMLRQRFRERSESWLGSSSGPPPPPPPHPPPSDLHNNSNPVSILTNTIAVQQHAMQSAPPSPHPNHNQQLNVPNSAESNRQDQQQHHQQLERPRKKLSFRDPEVTSTAGKNQQQTSSAQQPNATTNTQQNATELTDSMENIDLEVSFSSSFLFILLLFRVER